MRTAQKDKGTAGKTQRGFIGSHAKFAIIARLAISFMLLFLSVRFDIAIHHWLLFTPKQRDRQTELNR